jgi:hypothetical protein
VTYVPDVAYVPDVLSLEVLFYAYLQ